MSDQAEEEISHKRRSTRKKPVTPRVDIRKRIQDQQEFLKPLFEQAERIGVENVDRWKQETLLLEDDDIQELKDAIKEGKDAEKKRAIEKRRREREELAERKKPRDDLLCDDLKPLPYYREFLLPSWVPKSMYSDLLSLHNFFCCFSELMPDGTGKTMFSLGQIAAAVVSSSLENMLLVDVFKALLNAKADVSTSEDGDEANADNSEEIGNEQQCDLNNKIHGARIREINKRHEKIRACHGDNLRKLRVNQSTITEVIRLTLETSGYYPYLSSHAQRQATRGGIRCYEDEGYMFVRNNPDTMQKLKTASIFELAAKERLAIMKVFVQQLLSYQKYRDEIDNRMTKMMEHRRELKLLHQWDIQQEKETREAHQAKEAEVKVQKAEEEIKEEEAGEDGKEAAAKPLEKTLSSEKKRPSKELVNLRSYLRNLNEGKHKRINNTAEMRRIILETLPFGEMELGEIDEFRELQKAMFNEKLEEMLKQIYCLQARMGTCFLGRDRAYRSYFFVHKYDMFIIEEANPEEVSGDLRFFYFIEEDGVDKLLAALNPRGFREIELAENISLLKDTYAGKMAKLVVKSQASEFLEKHLDIAAELKAEDPLNVTELFDDNFRHVLLILEEKIYERNIGAVACNTTRENWRKALEDTGDTTGFCKDHCLPVHYSTLQNDFLYTSSDLDRKLNTVQKLCVAFLQVVHGVSFDCLGDVFVREDKKKKTNVPSRGYILWQKELVKAQSVSALMLFMTTFEKMVRWNHVKPPSKCGRCNKKLGNEKQVKCQACEERFHWSCTNIRKTISNSSMQLDDWNCANCVGEMDENDDEKVEQNIRDSYNIFNGRQPSYQKTRAHMQNGYGGYNGNGVPADENGMTLESRKRRAKRYNEFLYNDERSGNDSDNSSSHVPQRELRKRKAPTKTQAYLEDFTDEESDSVSSSNSSSWSKEGKYTNMTLRSRGNKQEANKKNKSKMSNIKFNYIT